MIAPPETRAPSTPNLKTTKALGLNALPAILGLAGAVIGGSACSLAS
jgi:hypothetical protein